MNINKITPKEGQESVWDYPRPPKLVDCSKRIRIEVGNITLVDSKNTIRCLETSHPPVYYIPQSDIKMDYLKTTDKNTYCEFKGQANYYDLIIGDKIVKEVAWEYANPAKGFEKIKNYLAFYATKVDACYVDDEKVKPQEGSFYGGWVTNDIVGPFKGSSGTTFW